MSLIKRVLEDLREAANERDLEKIEIELMEEQQESEIKEEEDEYSA